MSDLRETSEYGDAQPYDITEAVGAASRVLQKGEISNGRIVRAVMAVVHVVRRDFDAEIQRLRAVMGREHYASLEQLAPGDHIWLDGAWRKVLSTRAGKDGEIRVCTGYFSLNNARDFTAPAALLVRRAEQ